MSEGKPLILTMGDPGGIGAEVTLKAWRHFTDKAPLPVRFAILDDPHRLESVSERFGLGVPVTAISDITQARHVFPHALPVLPLNADVNVAPGELVPRAGPAVTESIRRAVGLVRDGRAAAVITNPIHKKNLYDAGFTHPGHTEFLAELDRNTPNAPVSGSVMMLANDVLRTVPLTVHLALKDVFSALTPELVVGQSRIVHRDLQRYFGISAPRLALSGLNPHAGEGGALGKEEEHLLQPAAEVLRAEGIDITDPLPADTLFHAEAREHYDIALCPTHDQALIPVKTLDFHGGVNVTLGLSYIRTSPDHGTAVDIAAQGGARADSLIAAITMAARMAARIATDQPHEPAAI